MGFWRSRVLPVIRKPFERNDAKKVAAAAEACKSFDESKEEVNKVFEEKKEELQPKVLEIYESSSADIKTVVKERKDAGLKQHAAAVNKFLEELVKIEFPGAKSAAEASARFGPALVPGPVLFVFEKVATFVPVEETRAAEVPAAVAEEAPDQAPAEESNGKEKEVAVDEEKKEETKEEEKAPAKAAPAAPAATEKKEETKEVEEEKDPAEAAPAAPTATEKKEETKEEEKTPAAAEKKAEEEKAPAAPVTPAATEATTSTSDQAPVVAAGEAAPAPAKTTVEEGSKA